MFDEKISNTSVAEYHEQMFRKTSITTHAIQACKNWRKANQPDRAVKISEGIDEKDTSSMAVLLTTRGGALRDLERLAEAEKCARRAIDLAPENYHAYNLLGAVLDGRGDATGAERSFKKARELGAPTGSWDS